MSEGRTHYVALIHGDDEPGFGVSFPDFPGCVSDGDTVEEAIRRGREALPAFDTSIVAASRTIDQRFLRGDERPVTERNEAALLLERAIVADLQERLNGIPAEDEFLLVCCGAVAQRLFERTQPRDAIRVVYAPHSSHGWWQKRPTEMKGVYEDVARMRIGRGRPTVAVS